MAYAKITNQAPFAANLKAPGEIVLQLDTGQLIAVRARVDVQRGSGSATLFCDARLVNADGTDKLDANGKDITSSFSHTTSKVGIDAAGGRGPMMKLCIMALLGESTGPLWNDAVHAEFLDHANIRTTIASALTAGSVTTLGAIL